jgi:hypothetical protein
MICVHLGTTIESVFALVDEKGRIRRIERRQPVQVALEDFAKESFSLAFDKIDQAISEAFEPKNTQEESS